VGHCCGPGQGGVLAPVLGVLGRTGLTVSAELDTRSYARGVKIPDRDMRELRKRHVSPHECHGEWNYDVTTPDLSG
jgi:hypothetical protein